MPSLNNPFPRSKIGLTGILFCLLSSTGYADNIPLGNPRPHHNIHGELLVEQGKIRVHDRIRFQQGKDQQTYSFRLNSQLSLIKIDGIDCDSAHVSARQATFTLYTASSTQQTLNLCYEGVIDQPNRKADRLRGGHNTTAAMLNNQGAYLSPGAYWYPDFAASTLSFELNIKLPNDWQAISQGKGHALQQTQSGRYAQWQETQPQRGIFLVAGPFHDYKQGRSQVYLRSDSPALAQRYLTASEAYLNHYEQQFGPYPYAKFATIENVWQTGYGMPSFTLLGSRVIRLPFILHTSFPHEIVHNWWGNGVYVDYQTGNWSEGLTTYLADHALARSKNKDVDYRRNALTAYSNYAEDAQGLALANFTGRHNRRSQAVGYGKSFFLFHMVRQTIGDTAFNAALRDFYQHYQFKQAGYTQLRVHFEKASGKPLAALFDQWVNRTDSPALAVHNVKRHKHNNTYRIKGRLLQTQPGDAYQLNIPVYVHYGDKQAPSLHRITSHSKDTPFQLSLETPPIGIEVDPYFDVFRRLSPLEIPPSMGPAFNAQSITLILPSQAKRTLKQAYQTLAESWQQHTPGLHWVWDNDIQALPDDGAVWILGKRNLRISQLDELLTQYNIELNQKTIRLNDQTLPQNGTSIAVVLRQNPPLVLLETDNPKALPGLARKLPHYGKYSYLAFTGDAPSNTLKGNWSPTNSPLSVRFNAQD